MEQVFSIGAAITFGWNKLKEQTKFLVGFVAFIVVTQIVISGIQNYLEQNIGKAPAFIFFMIAFIITMAISLLQVRIALHITDGKKGTWAAFHEIVPLIGKGIITQLLYSIIILVGFFLFIIPGFIWAIKYQFALYYVIDKNLSPFEALEASGKLTMGYKWQLLFLGLTLGLINIAGMLALGVGLLISLPVAIIAPAYVFREMQRNKGDVQKKSPELAPAL